MHRSLLLYFTALFTTTAGALIQDHQPCTNTTFDAILKAYPNAKINFVQVVPQDGSFGQGAYDIGFPANATHLPELCVVGVNVKSSNASSYNFGLFLPDSTWNERFLAVGNAGYAGGINWVEMGRFVQYGFSSMSTDTGHLSDGVTGDWGLNAPESLIDWGYRALHGSTVLSKEIVREYYQSPEGPKYSYYAGCSTGGRQGIRDVSLYPEDFDGIQVGSPAWWITHLSPATLQAALYNYPPNDPKYIPPSLFPVIVAEVTKQCDPQDGVIDGIIGDPYGCNFDYEQLLCINRPNNSSGCLTPAQLPSVFKFYHDWVDVNQTWVFPGFALGTDPTFMWTVATPLGSHYYQYWVHNDTTWDYTHPTYQDVLLSDKINPGQATLTDFDLSPYAKRGGKIFLHHGDADYVIPRGSSVYLYDQVRRAMRPQGYNMDNFLRLFLVPGAEHCYGSVAAPWAFGAAHQDVGATHGVPGFNNAKHDSTLALMQWVEEGIAPDSIIATKYKNDTYTNGVESQRPICTYPKQATYVSGDPKEAGSWTCKGLY